MDASESSLKSLMPIIVFISILLAAALFWCFLSSCLGTPVRRSISNLWEYTLLGAQAQSRDPYRRRGGAPYREDEIWEMQNRRRG
ncbi:hypothetical protein BDN70DRAFT_926653 [Pholiota conissans]|uniref:Uncharacterized protein n=1 Tax=Pholiota conissans TaxID=109636 RepID=A0A9P5ZFC6_9AGAR|nr:hypothetical protein BDN70DRAFT_926653 [Pholiota conissans]